MSIHPDYEGTDAAKTCCCEAGPPHLTPNGEVMFTCTRRKGHRGKHVATLPGHVVVETWPNSCPRWAWWRR